MIYAFRYNADNRHDYMVLVEFKSRKEMEDANRLLVSTKRCYRETDRHTAHAWVRNDRVHETGLYLDSGRIRYARSEPV